MDKIKMIKILIVTLGLVTSNLSAQGIRESTLSKTLLNPISQSGTISFELYVDKTYFNGQGQQDYSQSLIKLPGINEIKFTRTDSVINLRWTWQRNGKTFHDIIVDFADLPGPETYFLQYTWDSAMGLSQAYINGQPLRVPGAKFAPWWVKNKAHTAMLTPGNLKVENLIITSKYTPPAQALAAVPQENLYAHADLTGFDKVPTPIDISKRRGKLLYESLMDTPQSLKGWVKEGPVDLSFQGSKMLMRSVDFAGNIVIWCPQDFPESFIAEWDFQPLSHYGLAIVFFAAKGQQGQDVFDPSLKKRDGNFSQYIKGDITSYHVSYFANIENFQMGRTDSNLRKNNKFYRVSGGPIAVPPGTKGSQHIQLVKDRNRIQLFANGKISVDFTDNNPTRYGQYHKDGKIGLRQMSPTIGTYRNFRVWKLNDDQD